MFDMQGTRDDSIWKNLALAFGDGLAFGVGVNLSQSAARSTTPRADVRQLAERLNEIELRIERARQNHTLPAQFNQKVIEAVVSVVDARLKEQAERFEQRLAEEMSALRAEFGEQIAAARKHAEDENHILRGQLAELHRQFAESLGRMVEEQIAATIEVRLAPLEARLREEARQQADHSAAVAVAAAEEQVLERVKPLDNRVEDLDRRLKENDQNTLELVLALGQLCLQTAERLSAPAVEMVEAAQLPARPAPEPEPEEEAEDANRGPVAVSEAPGTVAEEAAAAEPEGTTAAAEEAPPAPKAAGSELKKAMWRMPLVSSFFMATTGLLLLHYL